MQERSSGDEWMAKSQSGRDKEVGGGRDLGLKVAGICGFGCGFAGLRHLVAKSR